MLVTLIASTDFHTLPQSVRNTEFGRYVESSAQAWHDDELLNEADTLAHFAGRACYQSWEMPNEATATDEGYIANILDKQHFSVLEHASATFYVTGVSRNLTHELIRHRHLSPSELSQRFVNMEEANFIVPPAIRENHGDEIPASIEDTAWAFEYKVAVDNLLAEGKTRKEAREAARFYLPSGMETKIVVTGNHRAWRDMLQKRYSVHADAEIREFAGEVLRQLREIAPATYQDFPEEPFK